MSVRDQGSFFGAAVARKRRPGGKPIAALASIALALSASTAAANGRFPRAQRLIQSRDDPAVLALYGTYGLLVSRDAGASWRHVCEAATGAYAGEDSLLEIMPGGRIVLRTDGGLARSDSSFCSYEVVLGSPGVALQDITRDGEIDGGLLALSTALGDDGVFFSSLTTSTDGGETFTPLSGLPPEVLELGLTLDVVPGRPELIYVSGFDDLGFGTLARSTDRGESFEGFPISGLGVAAPPYIAAVSAVDPDRVFVRTDELQRSDDDFEARETANDALYFTPDGGATWHRALNRRGKLFGFALSPDERWVLAGYGDPVVSATFVEPDELGLYRVAMQDLLASPDAPPWERIFARGVTCLRWTGQGLFACVAQDQNDFEVGRAADASFSLADESPFEPLLRLPEVRPLECAEPSDAAACLLEGSNTWLTTCSVLRAECFLDGGEGAADDPGAGGTTGDSSGASGAAPAGGGSSSTTSATTGGASGMGGAASMANPAGDSASGASDSRSPGEGAGPSAADAPPANGSGSCAWSAHSRATARVPAPACLLLALLLIAARRRELRRRARPVRRPRGERASGARLPGLRATLRNAVRVVLLALGAGLSGGCGDQATSQPDPDEAPEATELDTDSLASDPDCGGAGEDFLIGMSKTTSSGALTVAIVAAEPAPPLVGSNSWTLLLSDASGEAITSASVTLTGWMPQHGHGLNSVPLVEELDAGRYRVEPINLFMPQLWELRVVVGGEGETEVVTFALCIS